MSEGQCDPLQEAMRVQEEVAKVALKDLPGGPTRDVLLNHVHALGWRLKEVDEQREGFLARLHGSGVIASLRAGRMKRTLKRPGE